MFPPLVAELGEQVEYREEEEDSPGRGEYGG